MKTPPVEGSVADGFEPVIRTFTRLWDGIEVGASFCAFYQGRKVVDLWGGFQDAEATRPWQADTLVNVYSVTKGMAALGVACLADEGLISYERPVSHYWPEFGAAGKQAITVAQLLSHQAGVYRFEAPVRVEDLYDHPAMANRIAAMAPAWSPGTGAGYHGLTWGFAVNELVQRVASQSLASLFRQRIVEPLQAEFHIGLPGHLHAHCADMIGPNHARLPATVPARSRPKAAYPDTPPNPLIRPFKDASSRAWREAEIVSSNGQANARGIARVYAAMIDENRPLLSAAGLAAATHTEATPQADLVLAKPMHYCRGFMGNSTGQLGPVSAAFGHDGTGGSLGFADPRYGVAAGYAMNQMSNDPAGTPRGLQLVQTFYACL